MAETQYDFSGYATRYGLKCSDGRTIKHGAFASSNGTKVPLVYQHVHNVPENILGHAVLEHRADGVYAYGKFNDTPNGRIAKLAVQHGDLDALSIYANHLKEQNSLVHEGAIRELSLVLTGANPGAFIEHITMAHSDGSETEADDEAIIFVGSDITHGEEPMAEKKIEKVEKKEEEALEHADGADQTVGDVVNTMSEIQKKVMYALIAQAMQANNNMSQSDEKGESFMKENVFDRESGNGASLTHAQVEEFATAVFNDMPKYGTFKDAFLAHAGTYGIDNISYLFPDAKTLDDEPTFETRRMGWVNGWMSQTRHTPFARIKKLWADLTPDAARAKGYITGNQKVEQVFAMLKRTTEPTTIYKKQKLDRDDIVDITDFNVINWMWREMRFMLDEEVARAALVGDGRAFGTDDDAIDPSKIRPIYGDDPLFVHYLTLASTVTDPMDIMDAILAARVNYKGTGTPNFYTTNAVLTSMLLTRDTTNRRLYRTVAELAAELRVADIIEVEVLEGVERTDPTPVTGFTADLLGIMVNPSDYTYGADKGGQIATFEDFDIDFNQNKYLIETRLSGSLLNPKSALVVERKQA